MLVFHKRLAVTVIIPFVLQATLMSQTSVARVAMEQYIVSNITRVVVTQFKKVSMSNIWSKFYEQNNVFHSQF